MTHYCLLQNSAQGISYATGNDLAELAKFAKSRLNTCWVIRKYIIGANVRDCPIVDCAYPETEPKDRRFTGERITAMGELS